MPPTHQKHLQTAVAAWADHYGHGRRSLLPILQRIQEEWSSIPEAAMRCVAEQVGVTPAEVYSIVSFYPAFSSTVTGKYVVRLCRTVACEMAGKDLTARQLESELGVKFGGTTPDGCFTLAWTNCLGLCDQGPALLVNDAVFTRVTPARANEIVREYREAFLDSRPAWPAPLARCLPSNPTTTLTFASLEPGAGLHAALPHPRETVFEALRAARLAKHASGSSPLWEDWQRVASNASPMKRVICDAAEAEPCAFKDRELLTDHAHTVFEGMTIAGYATGCGRGVLCLREEFGYMRDHLEAVLDERRRAGFLGDRIEAKSGFSFDIDLQWLPGTHPFAEETALVRALDGFRGEPSRQMPPVGDALSLSCIAGVETFAWVTAILTLGPQWFRNMGTDLSAGPRVFSVAGDCAQPGVYEFPLGITVEQLLEAVGGINAQAVHVGGDCGTFVSVAEFGRRIAYEDLAPGGAITIVGPRRNRLRVTRNLLQYYVQESCGQCAPCREGIPLLLAGVCNLLRGSRPKTTLIELRALAESVLLSSKCRLGRSAANVFLSAVHPGDAHDLAR